MRLGAHDFDAGQQARLHLALVVAQQVLGELQVPAAGLDLGYETDEVPVKVDYVVDGGEHLLFEGEIGNLAVVLGDTDIDRVDTATEALRESLADSQVRAAYENRVEVTPDVVRVLAEVGKAELERGSGQETLRVGELLAMTVAKNRRSAAHEVARLRITSVVPAKTRCKRRIKVGHHPDTPARGSANSLAGSTSLGL